MNNAVSAPQGQHFYGQLLPLEGIGLLLPKQAMIEAVSMDSIRPADGPDWFLGYCDWRDKKLPSISLEALMGGEVALRGRRTRVAIINSLGSYLPEGLFGIATTAYPHLLPLNKAALQAQERREGDSDVVLARALMANRETIIPDLEMLEKMIAGVIQAGGVADDDDHAGPAGDDSETSERLEDWQPSIDLGLPGD